MDRHRAHANSGSMFPVHSSSRPTTASGRCAPSRVDVMHFISQDDQVPVFQALFQVIAAAVGFIGMGFLP